MILREVRNLHEVVGGAERRKECREGAGFVDTERLRGGGDPEDEIEPTDPRGLAERIISGTPPRAYGTAVERDGRIVHAEYEGG